MSEGAPPPTEKAYTGASPFQSKPKPSLLQRTVPVSQELPGYGSGSARRDEDLVDRLRKEGITLSIARAKTPLITRLTEGGLAQIPFHPTVRAAVEAAV